MSASPVKATVNEHYAIDLTSIEGLDLAVAPNGQYHIILDGKSFLAELVSHEEFSKAYTIRINGHPYRVQLADAQDELLQKLGFSAHSAVKMRHLKAPMPGLVLSINVEPGQTVHKGDALLILEAMKMENIIKSPGDGVVKKVAVQKGMAVDKGQILLEME